MFSIAARFQVLIWVAWTPYFFDNSASVISSRIASSATFALNSGAWFFLFVILDRLSHQSIHLNNWSEIPRPPLNAPVVEINQSGIVILANGDTISAGRIVLAVPPRVIAKIKITPDFDAAVWQSLANIPTWMGGQAKFIATYARPFWREQGLSGDAMSRRGPMVEIHDASAMDGTPGALFGFIGVPASQRNGQGDVLSAACVAQLGHLFGPEALTPQKNELRDWAYAPQTASSLDHQPPPGHPHYGLPTALRHLWQGKLIMGSTEVASQFGGFLEGALSAAEDAALILET